MSNTPFEQQRLTVDRVEQIDREIAQGNAVSGSELLRAIERFENCQLADRLRDVVRKFSVPAVRRRGRPSHCKGRQDFAMAELDARYSARLQKYTEEAQRGRQLAAAEGVALPRAEKSPSELAYTNLQEDMQADFPNIDWLALRNKHSEWKNGHFHPSDNHVDSEDFDAEIERQFPRPQDS
jgi:hypothetical protein